MVNIVILGLGASSETVIRLCIETPTLAPTAGGRVFGDGDYALLKFVQNFSSAFSISRVITLRLSFRYESVPIVIVFTHYDRVVRAKRAELKEDYPHMDDHYLDSRSVEEAWKAFERCLLPLRHMMRQLNFQMPPYARASGTFVSMRYLVLTGC